MSDKSIQNLVSGSLAFMFGFAIYKVIQVQMAKYDNGNNDGGLMAESGEPMAGASGLSCGASGAPLSFMAESAGCNYLSSCESNGGVGSVTEINGGGYSLSCVGGNLPSITTNSSGGGKFAPVRRTRSFF